MGLRLKCCWAWLNSTDNLLVPKYAAGFQEMKWMICCWMNVLIWSAFCYNMIELLRFVPASIIHCWATLCSGMYSGSWSVTDKQHRLAWWAHTALLDVMLIECCHLPQEDLRTSKGKISNTAAKLTDQRHPSLGFRLSQPPATGFEPLGSCQGLMIHCCRSAQGTVAQDEIQGETIISFMQHLKTC